MALEGEGNVNYIDDLSGFATNPENGDDPTEGAEHIRLTKKAVYQSFPNVDGAVTATDTQLNYVAGVTPGSALANGAVVLDANKDHFAIRNITLTGQLAGVTLITGAAVKDEDDMASDSTLHLSSQQSIKAYVDNKAVTTGLELQSLRTESSAYSATTVAMANDDTIPQSTEGAEIFSVAITPTAIGNKIKIKAQVVFSTSIVITVSGALFIDSTANALKAVGLTNAGAGFFSELTMEHEYTAVDTTEHTFKLRMGPESGTMYINGYNASRYYGGVANTFMSVTEVKQ